MLVAVSVMLTPEALRERARTIVDSYNAFDSPVNGELLGRYADRLIEGIVTAFTALVAEARVDERANLLRAYHVTLDTLKAPADEWPCNRVNALVAEVRREQRDFKTRDHPAAGGRMPISGDMEWRFTFPLDDGTTLSVRVGSVGRAALIQMAHEEKADDEIAAALRAQEPA